MKFKIITIFFFVLSCSAELTTLNQKKPYIGKGFAYIYNDDDYKSRIIKGKMNNNEMQISHQHLKFGTPIKIINPKKCIVLKIIKELALIL